MFEKEIKFIYDFNLNKINKYGSFFSFGQLKESEIHPAILQYISAEMDYLIFEDRQKLVKDSIFDYSGEKIASYFTLINEELKKSKRLSADYVAKIMLHAISFNVNFLVRPKWALSKFIYEDESHRTGAEIKQILNYVYFYKYLRKIIVSYINGRKVISLNSVEFAELLKNIDAATIQANYKGMLSTSLDAMAEFFNIGGGHRTTVPFNAVQIFLEDKGLEGPLVRLRDEYSDDPNSRIEINDLKHLLTSVLVKQVEVEPEPERDEIIEVEPEPISHPFEDEEIEPENEIIPEPEVKRESISEIYEEQDEEDIPEEDLIPAADEEGFEIKETPRSIIEKEEEHKAGFLESIISRNENKRSSTEFISEMESLIEEGKKSEEEQELEVEETKADYDDWVFVEEDEHKDIIKEIAEPSEEEVKKTKHHKKKPAVEDTEEPSLFEANKEMSFGDILSEEEELMKSSKAAEGRYEDSHSDFSKLIDHRDMTALIDTLFDCDIEELELMLNSISFFSTYAEAERFIDTYFVKLGFKPESDDVITFKNIIKENYTN